MSKSNKKLIGGDALSLRNIFGGSNFAKQYSGEWKQPEVQPLTKEESYVLEKIMEYVVQNQDSPGIKSLDRFVGRINIPIMRVLTELRIKGYIGLLNEQRGIPDIIVLRNPAGKFVELNWRILE